MVDVMDTEVDLFSHKLQFIGAESNAIVSAEKVEGHMQRCL